MEVPKFIAIAIPDTPKFFLVGQSSGPIGEIAGDLSASFVDIDRIAGPFLSAPDKKSINGASCNLTFASPVRIPGGLVEGNRLRSTDELSAALTAASQSRRRFIAQVAEAQRRMLSVEVKAAAEGTAFLGIKTPFGPAGAFAGAHVRLGLWTIAKAEGEPTISLQVDVELAACARIAVASMERAVSLVIVLNATVGAALRIDADDFGLCFPKFALPSFDLQVAPMLLDPLEDMKDAVSTLEKLNIDTLVKVTHTNASPHGSNPKLALKSRLAVPGIDWAVVPNDFDLAAEDLGALVRLAKFAVETTRPTAGVIVTIENLTLGDVHKEPMFGGVVKASMAPIDLGPGMARRFGPFEVSWDNMTVTPSHQGNAFGSAGGPPDGPTLRAVVAFERLTLRVYDDPDAFLTFTGKIEIDPSGTRLLELALVAPFPLVLLEKAAGAMLRSGAAVLNVLIDFAQLVADNAAKLLNILGRMALAAGRAAIFIAEQVGAALDSLGDLIARGLAAVAEMLGALFKQIGELLPSAGNPSFAVELRIATNPFELRQVLITSRDSTTLSGPRKLELLGFTVEIPGGWQPGMLLDFVTQPGAYLVLSRPTDDAVATLHAATLSTDLWLDQPGPNTGEAQTRPLHDVDGSKRLSTDREANAKPLISLELNLKKSEGASDIMLVLAGLTRGQTVFFQRLKGDTKLVDVPGKPGVQVRTTSGPFMLTPLADGFDLIVKFEKDRILPLLGMGESGNEASASDGPSFLEKLQGSLANVVWVKETKPFGDLSKREAGVDLVLGLKAAGLETSLTLKAGISLDTLAVTLDASNVFPIASERIEETALGLLWVIEQADPVERKANKKINMFSLGFAGGQSGFELNSPKPDDPTLAGRARMQLRFNGLSSDGQGVVFEVSTFKIGAGGLDLMAKVADNPVRLNGIDVPFHFTDGSLEIKGGRLVSAMVAGRGALPPDLIGEADCTVALTFGEVEGEGIVLQSGKVELDKKNDPIICHAARFTLTISDLDIAFVKDGGYHFYYLVTGSLRFTPKSGEFESGLLQYLDGVEMNLERTPLSADPRVLVKHISFQKTLNPKKSFNLFNLFTFELRGFGYHPASPKFDGAPAVNISGQIKFVEIGDVMQPSIDFHGLWIAPPAINESLPRIKADGLGIDLNLKGSIRVRGTVIAVDAETRTVEGSALAPEGYNTYGFLGRGEVDIPGWGSMGASLGFLEIERKDQPGDRRKSFFFSATKKKLSIEIPTAVWNFYLREAEFFLGFRYTLSAIDAADRATSIPKQISALDQLSKTQGDLHRFSSAKPEPEGDRVTMALKGAIQVYPANKTWDEKAETAAQNPFLFDLVAMIRSDFTLFMGLRGWVGTNYIDYLNDKDGLRSNPGLRGYLYISAPQQRLLARMIGDSKGYIGERIPALAKGSPMRAALQAIDWSATLFIKPGLFHYELGWPNQLVARLYDEENMRVTVRGGMIFRAADDGLLWGYNIEADAYFRFGGQFQAGPVGVCAEATLTAQFVARVLCYLSWRFSGSLVYGLIALDATLAVSFRAWMEVDLGFTSFTIRIGFSRTLQLSAAVEIALSPEGVGARVAARVAVSVFGCTLSVSVGFTIGKGQLEEARARVQRFMAMSITAEEPDAAPAALSKSGDERITADAKYAEARQTAPAAKSIEEPNESGVQAKPPSQRRAQFGTPYRATDFWCLLHKAARAPDDGTLPKDDDYCYAVLFPKEPQRRDDPLQPFTSAFYAAPVFFKTDSGERDDSEPAHILTGPAAALQDVMRYSVQDKRFTNLPGGGVPAHADWNKPVETEDGSKILTLALLFDECFLSDTDWVDGPGGTPIRKTSRWYEPPARIYESPKTPNTGTDEERNALRDRFQRDHNATAAANPVVDGVHQARSTVLAMFADQFVALAASGRHDGTHAHVTDLGLVFYGPRKQLEKLSTFTVKKDNTESMLGKIEVFNPGPSWFEVQDPILGADRSAVTTDGIKLGWKLQVPFSAELISNGTDKTQDAGPQTNPEQFLHHYEIVRTVEGLEFTPRVVQVKPAATIGGHNKETGSVDLLAPDWQYTDDLADLAPQLRSALLPSNDEAAAMSGAIAWANIFKSKETQSLSYTVTPVDIAGSRGLPKSFLIDVKRPSPQPRAAEAELRFVVTSLGPDHGAGRPHHSGDMPAGTLAVVMALKDPSPPPSPPDPTVRRYYVLYADPENISPSGHYGTDGLTERRLGMATVSAASADSRKWILDAESFRRITDANGKVPVDTFIDPLEPDHDTLSTYPFWRLLAGKTGLDRVDNTLTGSPAPKADHKAGPKEFLESLWRREGKDKGPRIATRFSLETVQIKTVSAGVVIKSVSKRVPVSIEVRVEPLDPLRNEIGLMRPEAFEWPVHLDMPPHIPGQVRASTGFARFRAPPEDALLGALLERNGVNSLSLVRDPERRILTKVSFDAAPIFDGASMAVKDVIDPVHASSVAGFDLHELDLDDLARLDTEAEPPIGLNATTWQRANRVARIERVSAEMARLLPDANKDWPGWHAHYPSETWRLGARRRGRDGQSVPRRAPWFSAAESTVEFASRTPRLRLFPTASEAAVSDLMAKGRPSLLTVSFNCTAPETLAGSLNVGAALELVQLGFGAQAPAPHLSLKATTTGKTLNVASGNESTLELSPSRVRAALLGLCCRLSADVAVQTINALAEGNKLVCSLTITGSIEVDSPIQGEKKLMLTTGTVVQPLTLSGPLHPILEEVIGELEYSTEHDGLYRRYVVSVQPVQPVEATNMAEFLANTAGETDPYGWAALQQLGLSCTLKLYDRDLDRFLRPTEMLTRVRQVFDAAVRRYASAYPNDSFSFGQAFVEILLRPGEDRVPGPFEAVLENTGKETEPDSLVLEDSGLSIAQLSLRPRPSPARRYFRLDMCWEDKTWPDRLKPVDPAELGPNETVTRSLIGYELEFTASGIRCELTGMQDGRTTELLPGQPERLPVSGWKKGKVAKRVPSLALQFFLRTSDLDPSKAPRWRLLARVRSTKTVPVTVTADDGIVTHTTKFTTTESLHEVEDLRRFVDFGTRAGEDYPTRLLVAPKGDRKPEFSLVASPDVEAADEPNTWLTSPFERFGALKPDEWAEALVQLEGPKRAFRSLRLNLRFAAPGLAWPKAGWHENPPLDSVKSIAAAYVPWTQRFLDHAAGPASSSRDLHFALAAPIRANPLNLAANAQGQITLSFLHADRWAHARLYAVRPTPRYQNLALGAGYFEQQADSERLVTSGLLVHDENENKPVARFKREIGFALAVSPRTERIEPPVILGSRLLPRGCERNAERVSAGQWELVLARHGEEALAFSNRPLFARLGTEGTSLSFVREYRDPYWPERLNAAIVQLPALSVNCYPVRAAGLATPIMGGAPGIDGKDLGELSLIYPSLWKGADVWRIGQLPAHYRVTALAVARAGLVVSRVITSVQDGTPRRPLNPKFRAASAEERAGGSLLGKPTLAIVRRDGGTAAISINAMRLVSHADLSEMDAQDWFTGGADDVAWWPDPNVRYTLLRQGRLGEGRSFEDEDAEIYLIASPIGADPGFEPEPIVVRYRGTRFAQPGASVKPVVAYEDRDDRRAFTLSFGLLAMPSGQQPGEERLRLAPASDLVTQAFNESAVHFANIVNLVRLDVGPFDGIPQAHASAQDWLRERGSAVMQHAIGLDASFKRAADALTAIGAAMIAEADLLAPAGPYDLANVGRLRTAEIELGAIPLDALKVTEPFALTAVVNAQILTLRDLPADDEVAPAVATGHPAAKQNGGRLWAACRQRLLGAGTKMAIRAVDTRNAIDRTDTSWEAPGEMQSPVMLPEWTEWQNQDTL
ncbi:MAG: hypothetical protein CFE43_21170 [Burkholderiales bacterium PBB3]|nr:MAG: hypothetical protein CFE43_21170 [Burkholderiales bacterium PBB3]